MTGDPNTTPDESPQQDDHNTGSAATDSTVRNALSGKTFGQFEIMEEIGRGGMATVYRARQKSIDRIVAVKVLPQSLLHDPNFFERFKREVDVISHLEHPHILPIYDYGQQDGIPFIAMRYLGGGSMEHIARRRNRPLETLERPLRQITQALDYAHRQGIIHRDIKPANIMLDEDGNAYLSDFGIARVLGSDLTGSMIIGTPAYMSPEQANGLNIDGRADVYALGVVLFELVTGRTPYHAETPMAVLLKHIKEPLPDIRELRPDCPAEVELVIRRATAKQPEDRYPSAGELAKAFSAALRGITGEFDRSTRSVQGEDAQTVKDELQAMLDHSETVTPAPITPMPDSETITPPPAPIPTVQLTDEDDDSVPAPATREAPVTTDRRQRSLLVFGVLAVALLFVAVSVALMSGATDGGSPTVRVEATAFPNSQRVQIPGMRVSVPQAWQTGPDDGGGFDISTPQRQTFVWQDVNASVYAAITRADYGLNGSESAFLAAVADFQAQFIDTAPNYADFIDEATAADGSIRRSYRFTGENPQGFGPGQVDVFYIQRPPNLLVMEAYTSDSSGNEWVEALQAMLDSLWTE